MKLMFATCCNSLVVPDLTANIKTACTCGQSSVWWEDPVAGKLVISSSFFGNVSVIGLHNKLLTLPCNSYINKVQMEEILQNTSNDYLFKTMNSLVIRFKPELSSDTRFIKI